MTEGESESRGEAGNAEFRRIDLSEDRTLLASERTFGGWLRTGLAAVGIGVGFNALFRTVEPSWLPKTIATIFVLAGILIFHLGERRALQVRHKLDAHSVELVTHRNLRIVAWMLIGAALALVGVIWVLM